MTIKLEKIFTIWLYTGLLCFYLYFSLAIFIGFKYDFIAKLALLNDYKPEVSVFIFLFFYAAWLKSGNKFVPFFSTDREKRSVDEWVNQSIDLFFSRSHRKWLSSFWIVSIFFASNILFDFFNSRGGCAIEQTKGVSLLNCLNRPSELNPFKITSYLILLSLAFSSFVDFTSKYYRADILKKDLSQAIMDHPCASLNWERDVSRKARFSVIKTRMRLLFLPLSVLLFFLDYLFFKIIVIFKSTIKKP